MNCMDALYSIFTMQDYKFLSVCSWMKRYVSLQFSELFIWYISKLRIDRNQFDFLCNVIRSWLRQIVFLPRISKTGVWDLKTVVQIQEYHGVLPIDNPGINGNLKRKREEQRTRTVDKLADIVISNYGAILQNYQECYYPNAKVYWNSIFTDKIFPLERNPTSDAMKAMIIFIMTHMELQLQKVSKSDPNYYPYFTIPGKKSKQFDKKSYFSKFVVFLMVNRGMAGKSGFKIDFLCGNSLPTK